jgi:CRISPR-associated endonuclease/helicase Cas3
VTLTRKDFSEFFALLHDGHEPFGWQERLLDELLDRGTWPERIVAPTGAGKTAAIDVHVFAVALTAGLDSPRLPRRLAMVVARRVLVDDQYEHAEKLKKALVEPVNATLAEVAARLRDLHPPARPSSAASGPLVVARLRGGAPPSREWRDHPTACAVICGTPDMWGSRLLFRGYGSSRRAQPREAGLLAVDAAVVVDEAHLSRQLLTTARRVSQLVPVAEEQVPVPALQVVETTATPAGDHDRSGDDTTGVEAALTAASDPAGQVGVSEDDLDVEPVLRNRLCRPKPVTLVPLADWPAGTGAQRRRAAAALADQAVSLLAAPGPGGTPVHTVGCYVNTVPMAVEVASALRARRRADGTRLGVVMVCGQVRPTDLRRLRDEHPGVLDIAGNPEVDVLVSTQSLEVGVDLDLAAVVTELAPGSALVQRAGRVNRRGLREHGPVHVITPAGAVNDRTSSGPYGPEELRSALAWIARRAEDPAGVAPWAVRSDPPPRAARRRTLFQRPEIADAWHWAVTGDQLTAEPQLDLWLAEDLDQASTAGLVVRDAMPADPVDVVSLIRLLPPQDSEVFAVSPWTAAAIVAQAGASPDEQAGNDDGAGEDAPAGPPLAVRVRGDDVAVVDPGRIDARPGDIFVIDSRTEAFTPSLLVASGGFSPPVPVAPDDDGAALVRSAAADVLHEAEPAVGRVLLRLERGAWPAAPWVVPLLKEYTDLTQDANETTKRRILRRLLTSTLADHDTGSRTRLLEAATATLHRVMDSDLILDCDDEDAPVRLVLVDRRRAWADERLRQTWLPTREPVPLDGHQAAVAERAAWLAARLGLPEPLTAALRSAGLHHDDGKADRRFQAVLGGGDVLLAKSGGISVAESRQLARDADLPARWRHEQRSVLACWAPVHATLPPAHAQLAARLVGTSHGHGRVGFPHTAAELLDPGDTEADRTLAEDLFDLGFWDDLIETTHRRWGVWGCAYLEALLRAADCQVSEEGT